MFIQGRGWSWIPGRAYRGAWVSWGVDDGYTYLGWAPLGPAFLWFGGVPRGFAGYYAAPWVYCPRGYVFAPAVGGHVVAGASAGGVASRVRPFAPAHPTVGGPSPQSMGYRADQVPAARGADLGGVSRAQAFGRPATAEPLGAHAPTRMAFEPRAPAMRPPVVRSPASARSSPAEARRRGAGAGPGDGRPASDVPGPQGGSVPTVRGGGCFRAATRGANRTPRGSVISLAARVSQPGGPRRRRQGSLTTFSHKLQLVRGCLLRSSR